MKTNPKLGREFLKVVKNQIAANDPPETRRTLKRLLAEGHERKDALRLIACVVASEMFDILQNQEVYNEERFTAALKRLPVLPWEWQVGEGKLVRPGGGAGFWPRL